MTPSPPQIQPWHEWDLQRPPPLNLRRTSADCLNSWPRGIAPAALPAKLLGAGAATAGLGARGPAVRPPPRAPVETHSSAPPTRQGMQTTWESQRRGRKRQPSCQGKHIRQTSAVTAGFGIMPHLKYTLPSFSSGFGKWRLFQKKSINVSVHKIRDRSNKGISVLKTINFVQHAFELQYY